MGLRSAVAAVLAVGLWLVMTVAVAAGPIFDDRAAWTCGATRPGAQYELVYAQPSLLRTDFVIYTCVATWSPSWCAWQAELTRSGAIFRVGDYQCGVT
jgi:hypothetical protein